MHVVREETEADTADDDGDQRRLLRARLRWLTSALLAGGPVLGLVLSGLGAGPATAWLALAALSLLAGSVVERWLFFAQARHVVTLYY
jgi:sulfite dehydrogenase (quinone) subunit SoeC